MMRRRLRYWWVASTKRTAKNSFPWPILTEAVVRSGGASTCKSNKFGQIVDPLWAYSVEKLAGGPAVKAFCTQSDFHPCGSHVAWLVTGMSFVSFLRFWTVAARWNSSFAPQGPRNRSLPRPRMRLRWANSISTFFLSLHETSYWTV
jgi:hypothetical protein